MKKYLVIGFLLLVIPIHGQEVVIDKVFVESVYNSRYILTFSNRLVPLGERINKARINCLTRNLTESKMFLSLETELLPADKSGSYSLVLRPVYRGNPLTYRIRRIEIDKSLGLDEDALRKELLSRNVKIGANFLPYTEIEVSIFDSIEALEKNTDFGDYSISKHSWVNAYLLDDFSIRIIISGKPPECPGEQQ